MSVKSRWFLSGCPFWLSACMLYHQKTKVLKRGRMMRIDVIKILLQGYAPDSCSEQLNSFEKTFSAKLFKLAQQ